MLGWIIGANVVSGILAVWLAGLMLFVRPRALPWLVPRLVDFAIGSLLGAGFLGLLPAALAERDAAGQRAILLTALAGLLVFLALERLLVVRHCHATECPAHDERDASKRATVGVILLGDGLHDFVDGAVIAAAFLAGPRAGVAATIAVLAPELPQELGDIGVLVRAGLAPRRAILWNSVGALASVVGGVVGYVALERVRALGPYALAISFSSFVYVALADLVPSLHAERVGVGRGLAQLARIVAGVATFALAHALAR